ncbi:MULTISPECIES: hypothetical protein [Hymenobacter]|uniref:Helix-hairpin-helix domain-containing protein n=2 Tax=Hymenobacter TaxID=89966 RepID=A0ABS6WW61_9BACT|nr:MULTISPECIES: hypothetical protein [Hymenobacter]MBO3270426.1 hypothetical protein [Hymenobacter defluvii]MBW3127794.1 hypothetical protein [Hymenobacter profundi]
MNTPFRLDDHPRRPYPLAPPPAGYFEQLPRRVMDRVQPTEAPALGWLSRLPLPLRTALASTLLLGGFAASLVLSVTPTSASATLAAVPQEELVQYLLANDSRVTLADLADLSATAPTTASYLHASPEELQSALDAQPTDDSYL